MNEAEFKFFCFQILEQMRMVAPRDTGNLAENALNLEVLADVGRIRINLDIAPYQVYLDDGTEKSQKHKNWFERAFVQALTTVVNQYGGYINVQG